MENKKSKLVIIISILFICAFFLSVFTILDQTKKESAIAIEKATKLVSDTILESDNLKKEQDKIMIELKKKDDKQILKCKKNYLDKADEILSMEVQTTENLMYANNLLKRYKICLKEKYE